MNKNIRMSQRCHFLLSLRKNFLTLRNLEHFFNNHKSFLVKVFKNNLKKQ